MRGLVSAIRARIRDLRQGFLFLPGVVAAAVAVLAPILVTVDRASGEGQILGFSAEPDAARSVLATIAGSLITVAGLTFSITIVSLQLVSQQFSPRALRGFLGDRLNQVVVGTFVGTFIFSVLVLRTVTGSSDDSQPFVPGLAVATAIALAVLSIALLLVFIHHMSQTIQVSTIAAGIARATLGALDPLYADTFGKAVGDDPDELLRQWASSAPVHRVYPTRPGYLQAVAFENLPDLVSGPGLRARIVHAPGDFVTEETPLVEYWQAERDEHFERAVLRATRVHSERDLHQDVDFGLRQLADIALKAISPGVNDPTTAVTCIGYIRAILERLAARATPVAVRRYEAVDATMVARARPFPEYLETGLVEIGRYADRDPRVATALLRAIAAVLVCVGAEGEVRRDALAAAAADIVARAREHAVTERDAADLAAALEIVEAARAASMP